MVPSIEHWNVAPASLAVKLKAGVLLFVGVVIGVSVVSDGKSNSYAPESQAAPCGRGKSR